MSVSKRSLLALFLVCVMIIGFLPDIARGEANPPGSGDPYGIERAIKAYSALDKGALEKIYDQGQLASYPEKDRLLKYGDQLVPEIDKILFNVEYEYIRASFAIDLLGSIQSSQARQSLIKCVENGGWLPVIAAALNQNQDREMIKSLLDRLMNGNGSPNYSITLILGGMGDVAAEESNRCYLGTGPGDERRIQLISVLSSNKKGRTLLMDDFSKTADRQEKNLIISQIGSAIAVNPWGTPPDDRKALVSWLRQVAANDLDASCRQDALAALYNAGDKAALARLVSETEKNGTFRENSFWGWRLLYTLNQQYPDSFIARGIAEYERVRNMEYFVVDRPAEDGIWWGYEYGDKQYNPAVEIPGFESFLANFPGHPATDSASYRLGRCYEIRGRYSEALNLLLAAAQSPNGSLKWDASQRVIFVCDVVMNEKNTAEVLASGKLNPELVPLVEYSRAVKFLRANDYAQADTQLTEFINKYQGKDVYSNVAGWGTTWNFWDKVEGQRDLARNLAGLLRTSMQPGETGRAAQYKLAAAIYHDIFIFYNHFWQGGRRDYVWMGHIAETYDDPAEQAKIKSFLLGHNNYVQALNLFKSMESQPGLSAEMREKADYNVALCYLHLKYYGSEIKNLYPGEEINTRLVESFQEFIDKYPDSEMRAKALLALGAEQPNREVLLKLIELYPESDEADKAKQYLNDHWLWNDPHTL